MITPQTMPQHWSAIERVAFKHGWDNAMHQARNDAAQKATYSYGPVIDSHTGQEVF